MRSVRGIWPLAAFGVLAAVGGVLWMRGPLLRAAGVTTTVTEADVAAWKAIEDEAAAIGAPAAAKKTDDDRVGPCEGESGQSLEIDQEFEVADPPASTSYYREELRSRGWAISANPNADIFAEKRLAGTEVRFFLKAHPSSIQVSYGGSGSSSCGTRL